MDEVDDETFEVIEVMADVVEVGDEAILHQELDELVANDEIEVMETIDQYLKVDEVVEQV